MGGFAGTDGGVSAAVVDGSGNFYLGGWFTVAGEGIANRIAKWNGTSWTALGSGLTGGNVDALAVSGKVDWTLGIGVATGPVFWSSTRPSTRCSAGRFFRMPT